MTRFAHITYTDTVRQTQAENGSAAAALHQLDTPPRQVDPLGPAERRFITERDGFYLATVSETGWPYIQHRGGPPGFVHPIDDNTLAFADVRGNRQYITIGNIRANNRVALFFMDYAHQTRLKVLGHASIHAPDENPRLTELLHQPNTDGKIERLITIQAQGISWNCHKHITPRFNEEELDKILEPVRHHLTKLRQENTALKAEITTLRDKTWT